MPEQCPTCGRVSEDWSNNRDSGIKGKRRGDSEDRAQAYRDWRMGIGGGLYVMDIDQVEWRLVGDHPSPVALVELTRVDGNMKIPQTYLDAIVARFTKRDGQASLLLRVAESLGINAWISLFRWDLSEFWVYNLSTGDGWWHVNKDGYVRWLEKMT
jgi:hypothetical protein